MKEPAELELRQSRQAQQVEDAGLFRLLVDRVVDYAIFLLTPDGHVASWNAGAERLKGYRADEIVGHSFENFYPPEARAEGRPGRLLAIARADGRVEDEGWRVRKDGSRFWADVVITALTNTAGELIGFAKVTRDLTDRRQAEDERARRVAAERAAERIDRLQVATAALAAASRPQQVAEVLADTGAWALRASAAVVALARPGDASLTVTSTAGEAPEAQRVGDEVAAPLAYAWRRGRPLILTSREQVQADDPELVRFLASSPHHAWVAIPLVLGQRVQGVLGLSFGQPRDFGADERGFLLALADVAAQALERARLYESEQRARAEAEAAVRAQDEFLSLASHELRTPVAGVKAMAQLAERAIQRGQLDPQRIVGHLQSIARSADRLGALVDDLLDISRLRTGRLPLRPELLDVRAMLREIGARHAATMSRHHLEMGLPDQRVLVQADPLRLEQVLDNLLSNAVKYSPSGGEIQVRLCPDGHGWTLSVTDHGIGLPAGEEEHIFETFGRASNAATQHIQGLGLGLAICRQLVEAHGGRIWATSPGEGQGATLSVWLPSAPGADDGQERGGG